MKSSAAVGKRIVAIEQQRVRSHNGDTVWHVGTLVLEDGTRLVTSVRELGSDYGVEIAAFKNGVRL